MKGNEAVALAAIKAGCKAFFGYPITPQNEIPEYFSKELPKVGGVFVQAESEVAAINMVCGASAAGFRTMTSSSSPGIALKQEGIGFLSKGNLPAVIVNMMRGGPGLGSIQPAQGDYNMCVKGGSNGDYHNIVLAPANIQEAVDMVIDAFDLSDLYLTPVIILSDGLIGQMMEPVSFNYVSKRKLPSKDWALTGKGNGQKHSIVNLNLDAEELENVNIELFKKYSLIEKNEKRHEDYRMEDAKFAFVSYGTASRVTQEAVDVLRDEGYNIGLIRPQTLWPFPDNAFERKEIKKYIVVEMSMGQMVPDVKVACNDKNKVVFYGRTGGVLIGVEEILKFSRSIMGGDI
jgi:2-oxoglutarate ferredoxin oxidoreductase subunit alpha